MPNPKLETYKNKATDTVYDLTDADAQSKLTAILDGTDIDTFADVESALSEKADLSIIYPVFSTSQQYTEGDVVIYQGKIYAFFTIHNPGAWNSSEVDELQIKDIINHRQPDTNFDSGDFNEQATADEFYHIAISLKKSTTPTSGDTKPITSGAVYTALQGMFPRSEQVVLGAKNLLLPNVSKTITDVTFTVDENGVVTVNGTASEARNYEYFTMTGDGKDYIINCGNPNVASSPAPLGFYVYDSTVPRQYDVIGTEDKKITFTEGHTFTVYFVVRAGNTVTNEKLYPMLRLATDIDSTYAPYAMTNRELTENTTKDLLWTNPDPSQTFASQAVAVTIPNYDYYILETQNKTTSTGHVANVILEKNVAYACMSLFGGKASSRPITLTNTSISCGDAGNTEVDNTLVIPKRLFGIRKL